MKRKAARAIVGSLVVILTCAWSVALFSTSSPDGAYGQLTIDKMISKEEAIAGLKPPIATMGAYYYYNLNVPTYNQNDPAWQTVVMHTCGRTIGAAGCALTSSSMVFIYWGALSKNPLQLDACTDTHACPLDFSYAADWCSESKAVYWGSTAFDYYTMLLYLSSDYPPIIWYYRASDDKSHYCVVRYVNGDYTLADSYVVNDPWDGTTRSLTYWTLAPRNYSLYKLCLYRKR